MRNRKLSQAFGLSVIAAFSMMAFTAASAQAGVFKVNGQPVNLLLQIVGSLEGLIVILVPGRNLSLICHGGKLLSDAHIISSTLGLGKLLLENCLPFSHTKGAALACTTHNPELFVDLVPALHPFSTPYIIWRPAEATFGSVIFLGESCPLPEVNTLKGEIGSQVTTNNKVQNLVSFKPGMLSTLLTSPMTFGGSAASVEGSLTLEAAGAHTGLTFGIG